MNRRIGIGGLLLALTLLALGGPLTQRATASAPLAGCSTPSFGPPTNFAAGSHPHDVAVGDFNHDGKLDLVNTNNSSASVSVRLGTGNGGFGTAANFAVGQPEGVAVADFNRDGNLDLAVADSDVNTGNVAVLLGTGTGSFGAATGFPM